MLFFLFILLICIFFLLIILQGIPLRIKEHFPFIISKDFYGKILILYLYLLQIHFGWSSLSHPDNAFEACGLLIPLQKVPEWYFLCQYAMLKAVPESHTEDGRIIIYRDYIMGTTTDLV